MCLQRLGAKGDKGKSFNIRAAVKTWKQTRRKKEETGERRAPPDSSPKAIYYAEVAFSKEAMLTVN